MRKNEVKAKLARGDTAVGTMVFEFNSTGIGKLAGESGAEFVIFDMEHTGWSIETIRMLVATTIGSKALPMVRVPATQYHLLSRPLDVGAMGLMVPMVESVEQAKTIVHSAKYFPEGGRGAAFGVAHDEYAAGEVADKMRRANEEGMLIAQIETVDGVENCEAIAAVDGIDCLWVGHFDLTQSMGIPAQFEDTSFKMAIERVATAAEQHGKSAGAMVSDVENAKMWMDSGYRNIAYGGDLWLYGAVLSEGIAGVRNHIQ